MFLSSLDLYTIGIGPSSSHTVGPMRAARKFRGRLLDSCDDLAGICIRVELYGSLALTGKGHGTDRAILAGLAGAEPESVDPDFLERCSELDMPNGLRAELVFNRRQSLPEHPNGMRFQALRGSEELLSGVFFSIGGGFILEQGEDSGQTDYSQKAVVPYPFHSGKELVAACKRSGLAVSELVLANEHAWHAPELLEEKLDKIWAAMKACVLRGCERDGVLPGGLKVPRRAPRLHQQLQQLPAEDHADGLTIMDWVNLYAIAVNEENASGGRVVTAPTNGAAGIIPAVMHYAERFARPKPGWHRSFLLTAAAVGMLFKENASISGADVGCQGEVGVACSMAAAALTEILGGNPAQVENAAEIGMEHNLGLTCDPIGGLVQIPCIERNAMGAVKAINAARLAISGDGEHKVSLDSVIRTMRATGRDMHKKYKETSRGGLAVNVTEC
ncbi:MAG: L-serine ammonia-lyase [Opitutales bacterium]|nr:L-serine ammonia-lyase [Opitutales bacterium]